MATCNSKSMEGRGVCHIDVKAPVQVPGAHKVIGLKLLYEVSGAQSQGGNITSHKAGVHLGARRARWSREAGKAISAL